jgi:hypothetical protein
MGRHPTRPCAGLATDAKSVTIDPHRNYRDDAAKHCRGTPCANTSDREAYHFKRVGNDLDKNGRYPRDPTPGEVSA